MKEAILWKTFDKRKRLIRCELCNQGCVIADGKKGFCGVRKNIGGKLYSLNYGKDTGLSIDPIEKKPFFHFHPGTPVLSFGTPGCNFHCMNCQNWHMSQGPKGSEDFSYSGHRPEEIVDAAIRSKVAGIAYTYSEPTIFFEFARDTILEAKVRAPDLYHVFVSNGFFSKKMFDIVKKEKLLSAIRLDLKFMDDKHYKDICSSRLDPVLKNIKKVHKSGIHLEVICLIIPTLNDNEKFYKEASEFIRSVSPDIPLHFSAFFPHYKLSHLPQTRLSDLDKARETAKKSGLKYVYTGNLSSPKSENTYCPACNLLLIERERYGVVSNKLEKPECPKCGEKINILL